MHIDAVRRFNRFYTRRIGVLRAGLLGSPYRLAEARLLYELAQGGQATASALGRDLGLDLGYLSRLLQGLKRRGLVRARRAAHDGRQSFLTLTAKGRQAFAVLDSRSRDATGAMLAPLPEHDRERLVGAMRTVEGLLSNKRNNKRGEIVLREHRPGDLGWVVQRHGALYAAEYGWDASFEALVAQIVADYAARDDHRGEAVWIAELGGEPAGCVFCVRKTDTTAQLRLLLVEPRARGLGMGGRLVAECVSFARGAGYREVVLWTNDVLHAARRIYQRAGFQLVSSQPHHAFGHDLVEQDWRLPLA